MSPMRLVNDTVQQGMRIEDIHRFGITLAQMFVGV
jgi:hypothetical protein